MMRLFVALVPPPEAVEHLDDFLEVRRSAAPFRWAGAEQFHVTLAFLADVEERRIEDLTERLGRAAAKRTAFGTAIAGGGAFPNAARARVLWAGLDLDEPAWSRDASLSPSLRSGESRHSSTFAAGRGPRELGPRRLGHPAEVSSWVRLLDGYAGPRWVADRITLVESHLGEGPRGRPRYDRIEELLLSG
jgi:2'-5' RNA ligase